jgi:CheY-like chemotaxis protein
MRKTTILIVEDNFENSENMTEILEFKGFMVHSATNGKKSFNAGRTTYARSDYQ